MLVLSREHNDRVIVRTPEGRVIRMTIVEIRGDTVRVGWEADRDVIVDREEVWRRRQQECHTDEAERRN